MDKVEWDTKDVCSSEQDTDADTIDYYRILGVERKAEKSEIKRAYRKKAAKVHPDKSIKDGAEAYKESAEEMKRLNIAKDILLDDEKRRDYDKMLEQRDLEAISEKEEQTACRQLALILESEIEELVNDDEDIRGLDKYFHKGKKAVKQKNYALAYKLFDKTMKKIKESSPKVKRSREAVKTEYSDMGSDEQYYYDQYYYQQMVRAHNEPFMENLSWEEIEDEEETEDVKRAGNCPECGNPVNPDQTYCYVCGKKL